MGKQEVRGSRSAICFGLVGKAIVHTSRVEVNMVDFHRISSRVFESSKADYPRTCECMNFSASVALAN
eukprot:6156460-Amphidinium_carterae.2